MQHQPTSSYSNSSDRPHHRRSIYPVFAPSYRHADLSHLTLYVLGIYFPQSVPFRGRFGPSPNVCFLGPRSPRPKWHLSDQFIRFCRAHGHDQQTQTDYANSCIAICSIWLVLRCSLKHLITIFVPSYVLGQWHCYKLRLHFLPFHQLSLLIVFLCPSSRRDCITLQKGSIQEQQQQQPFNGRLSGTTRVDRYQEKHSPDHTHPGRCTSFITFLHLERSMASSLFSLRA